jgi:hypothetical protein
MKFSNTKRRYGSEDYAVLFENGGVENIPTEEV